jgi:hypothetical protein
MVVYLIIQFLVVYFCIKKWSPEMLRKITYERTFSAWVETKEFWYIALTILFWPVVIPSMFIWKILDKLTAKYFNN